MNLGTLWFGADIDLNALRQKIQSGNQSILNALKMDYDPASYQQMVTKLRSALDRETFQIRVTTNAAAVQQSLHNTLQTVTNGTATPKIDLSGLKGISGMTRDITQLNYEIFTLSRTVNTLKKGWKDASKAYGENSRQARAAQKQYEDANNALLYRQHMLKALQRDRSNATLAQAELNRQTRDAAKAARQWNSDSLRLNATLAGGIHISTQLGSALSSLFAIDYARQFLGNVIEIGGQLEKQRISIGAILGDAVKANHLFEQIKGLALQSPFGVVELDQYTKQLSAYGFKYSELFDMTKRLADISAGAGTDIGRLTLALGHVRSATYLTGITLRQFSMNNIPMLKMLADYYTEVEKKAVSTADVQKRISKRQVSYEDVIEQIRRLTNEGGMFYNMQEKISESLAAKFKNLKDAMDIMYGEMAEGAVGDILKGLAANLLKLTRHWREVANVLGVVAASFLISKLRIGFQTMALQGNTLATMKQIMANKQLAANNLSAASTYRTLTAQETIAIKASNSLTVADIKQALAVKQLTNQDVLRLIALKKIKIAQAMHLAGVNGITAAEIRAAAATNKWKAALAGMKMSLKNAFAGVGMGTWTTIGLMVGMELYSAWDQWNQRIDDKSREMTDLVKSRVIDLQKMQRTISKEGKPTDNTALKGRVDEMKQVLANSEAYTKTLDEQLEKAGDLPKQYDILADAIGNAVEKNRQMLDYQERIAVMIKASRSDFSWWDVPKGLVFDNDALKRSLDFFFTEGIGTNMNQVLDTYKDLRAVIDGAWEYKDALKNLIEEMIEAGTFSEEFANRLKNAPFEEQIRLLAESGYWQQIKDKIAAQYPSFLNFADKIKEASNGVTERWEEIANDDIPRMLKKEAERRGRSEEELNKWCLENIDDFKMMLDGINDQLGIKEPEIRRSLKRLFYDYVRLGNLSNAAAGGALVGAAIFDDEKLKKLLEENELADIKDKPGSTEDKDKGNKKDEALEKAKTILQEYKSFLSEYKKYREQYSKEKAINLLEKLFPNLKGQGANLVDNYASMLDKLRDSLEMTTEARKTWANDVNKTKADTLFDQDKDALKRNAEAMEEYTKRMEEQWKLYRSLLKKSGGNRDFAMMAFNGNGKIWDDTAKEMLSKFNQRGEELGVLPVGFHWDMNESELKEALVDANGQVQDELVKLAKKIQDVIRGNYKQFLEDSASAYEKSLTASEKLVELERQRTELINKRDYDNDQSSDKRNGWNAQISAVDKQIADERLNAFKETEDWGRIFANLDNISTSTLENMLAKLQAIIPSIKDSTEGTKALYEAMDKIQEKLADRNPFTTIFGSIRQGSRLRQLYKAMNGRDFTPNAKSAKYYGLQEGKVYKSSEIRDLIKKAGSDLEGGLEGLAAGFKAVEDVLTPVIELFDTLGNEDLSKFFQMGSNALSAAAQTAGGLNALGLGNLGPYGAAAAAGLSIVSSLFAMHDEALQEEIEASEQRQKEMENLTKNLETALDRTLGGVYNTKAGKDVVTSLMKEIGNPFYGNKFFESMFGKQSKYKDYISADTVKAVKEAEKTRTYYDAAYASLLAQRDELQHQMESEEDKKDSDSSKIADYKQQIKEMEDEIDNFAQDMAKTLYDIDIKSWASELGDALFEAWQKGEDGAEAFAKKTRELLADVTKNIITTRIIETALEPVLDAIRSEMIGKDGKLDAESIGLFASKLGDVMGWLPETVNAAYDAIDEELKKRGLGSMKDEGETSSSASATIKSITEQTADLLASYVNGIRADVSVIRGEQAIHLPTISSSLLRVSVLAETQVTQLQQIASNTMRNADAADRIYDIMHKIDTGVTAIKMK